MTLDEKMKELYKDITKQLEEYQKALDEIMSEKIDLENIMKEVKIKLESIYFLKDMTITNNAVEKIDECIEILNKVKE